ncbi:MAG: HEAT repeat domain-containing protein [Phycisphaeraceae bacterium]|nr:HEAT repeat domain-containing protein [Phycisphaerales bacterium]MCB9859334.1 HEAT repeat domain-containing protein [Phycisphaeraceae bacterium]
MATCAIALTGCGWLNFDRGHPQDNFVNEIFSPTTPLQAAQMATNPYDSNERYRGVLLLANAVFAGEDVYLRLFEASLQDEDEGVRAAGARGLANHGNPSHAIALAALLNDTSDLVRLEVTRGLQRLHNPEVVPALLRVVSPEHEESAAVRAEAADALGQYDRLDVVDTLITALDDQDLSVNRNALRSLHTLTGQSDLGLNRSEWSRWRLTNETPSVVFAGRTDYIYPVYSRSLYYYEYLPLVPPAPIETPSTPAGFPRREN